LATAPDLADIGRTGVSIIALGGAPYADTIGTEIIGGAALAVVADRAIREVPKAACSGPEVAIAKGALVTRRTILVGLAATGDGHGRAALDRVAAISRAV